MVRHELPILTYFLRLVIFRGLSELVLSAKGLPLTRVRIHRAIIVEAAFFSPHTSGFGTSGDPIGPSPCARFLQILTAKIRYLTLFHDN